MPGAAGARAERNDRNPAGAEPWTGGTRRGAPSDPALFLRKTDAGGRTRKTEAKSAQAVLSHVTLGAQPAERTIRIPQQTAFCGLAGLAAMPSGRAWAHTNGSSPGPQDLWAAWTLDPLFVVPLVVAIALYARGVHLAWRHAGLGRGVSLWQVTAFAGGLLALILALVWPLDALGEALFSAHMVQHVVLMNLAAPLLVLGLPAPTMLRALPQAWRRRSVAWARRIPWRWASSAAAATLLQMAALWIWHVPDAITLSLRNDAIHNVMHVSLFGTALLFWFRIAQSHMRGYGPALLALVVTAKLSSLLGGLLIFAPRPLYMAYGDLGAPWGLTLLEDQQLAGLLMMTPGALPYVVAGVVLVALCLARLERRQPFAAPVAAELSWSEWQGKPQGER